MFENTKNWILQNILSNVKEHNSAKLIRESLFKVMEQTEQFIVATGAGLYPGKISPNSPRPAGFNSGVFLATEQGTYTNFGNVVLPANSFGFILWNGSAFTISTVPIPLPDVSGDVSLNQTTKAVNGDKVFKHTIQKAFTTFDPDILTLLGGYNQYAIVHHLGKMYISNKNGNFSTPGTNTDWNEIKFSAEVDQVFDENSENAISNKKVSIIKNALDYFIEEANVADLPLNFVQGIIDSAGNLNLSTTSTKIFTIDVRSEWQYLKISAKHWQSTSQSAVDQYPTILAQKSDNTFGILEVSKLVSNSSSVPSTFELRIDNPQNYKKIFINALNAYANNDHCAVIYSDGNGFNSVKKYIDNALDTDKLSIVKQEAVDTNEVEFFDISKIKPNYSMSGVTGAEASVTGANISNWIDVRKGDTIRINSDRVVVGYKSNGNPAVSNVQKIYSAINTEPVQMERVIVITDDNIKAIRFVYMSTFTNIYAKKTSQVNSGNYYIDARDVRYGDKSITDYLNSSKQAIKPYIYPLRKKIINASIRENDIISAIGNNIVKYGLNEVETIVHTVTSVSDWRCVWTAKNGITYFSPMNSYSNGTDVSNYGLYRYDDNNDNNVTKVIQLTNRQSIWGIDEDNQGNLYAGVYDLGGASNPSLFKSTDGGITWNVVKSWSSLKHIHDVMIDKKTNHLYVFLGDTYSAIQNFKSTDGGITWQDICPMDKIQMTDSVASENYRFFGTDHSPYGRIYRTADDLTMSICLDIGYYSNIFFLRVSDLTGWIYAGFKSDPSATGSGLLCSVWVSKNEGDTWEEVKRLTAPIAGDGFWFASEFKDGNLIVGCRQGGNGHANWQGYGITENANLMYNSEGIVGTRLKAFL